ncbi:hypothetical protein [Curtobacterium sp. MCBD17_040]|uniref:hypothetical protein n=1 Tax=Curtobacterium sp. MCBD17_040 TaxID=2175674 RepID=UPI0015E89CDA|nr:hypothetical protein [Curtobacterium sp. MCBD17_040]WIB65409.1 hypothetical protein DEI94_18555 [Curtobacterium sp. MCBD17_040]
MSHRKSTSKRYTNSTSKPAAAAIRRRLLPATRSGWRLTILGTFTGITAAAVPTGWFVGKHLDDEGTFLMVSFVLPFLLSLPAAAGYLAIAARGALERLPRIRFSSWPAKSRSVVCTAIGIAASAGVAVGIQVVLGNIPVGLLAAAALAAAAAVSDIVAVIRRRFVA